jgi:hypothetical protein
MSRRKSTQPVPLPSELNTMLLFLRAYHDDIHCIAEEPADYLTADEARAHAVKILLANEEVVRVVLCGLDFDGTVIESTLVWYIQAAKPYYVFHKKTYQSEAIYERFITAKEALTVYRSYRTQNVIADTNAIGTGDEP